LGDIAIAKSLGKTHEMDESMNQGDEDKYDFEHNILEVSYRKSSIQSSKILTIIVLHNF
jgi:hypothetical protein